MAALISGYCALYRCTFTHKGRISSADTVLYFLPLVGREQQPWKVSLKHDKFPWVGRLRMWRGWRAERATHFSVLTLSCPVCLCPGDKRYPYPWLLLPPDLISCYRLSADALCRIGPCSPWKAKNTLLTICYASGMVPTLKDMSGDWKMVKWSEHFAEWHNNAGVCFHCVLCGCVGTYYICRGNLGSGNDLI